VIRLLRGLRLGLSALRLWPHGIVLATSRHRGIVRADIARWESILYPDAPCPPPVAFVRLMTRHPEFRNLFYHRTGMGGRFVSPLCRPLSTLYITTPDIGPGLYIQHGFATIISARRIGRDCWINQQVTIGYANRTDAPTLGDGVTVNAGAKVIGAVHVGDRARIGANAVVVKDVPPDVTVVGVPARIVRRNGARVDEAL
jgi:serine O-acetyltransferase